jgi:hypothetical protein
MGGFGPQGSVVPYKRKKKKESKATNDEFVNTLLLKYRISNITLKEEW